MQVVRAGLTSITTAALVVGMGVAMTPAAYADVKTVDRFAAELVVQPEAAASAYDRSAFRHWVDADGDGCDTRQEVLIEESFVEPVFAVGSTCTVVSGEWFSFYDGAETTNPSDLDIDHTVALEEAWSSGASRWTAAQREAYANDLDDNGLSLEAVTDNVNASKGARDLAEWLPPDPAAWCDYTIGWVATKWRWNLAVDSAEVAAAREVLAADACGELTLDVVKAGTPSPTPTPPPVTAVDNLRAGTVLASGSQLASADGRYRATMQADGNFVVYAANGRAVWASMTFSRGASLSMQADGNLVMYSTSGQALWFTSTFSSAGNGGGARLLRLGNDGNLVLYRGTNATSPIWFSGWDSGRTLDPTRGNELLPGMQLSTGQAIYSPSRRYGAVMQADGNFVVYAPGNRPLWNAGTFGANHRLIMQPDGNLVEYDLASRARWNAGTFTRGSRVVLQDDGNLVVYRPNGTAAFYTGWDRGVTPPPATPRPPTPVQPPPTTPPPPTQPANPGDTKNCSSFRTQREAQAWFDTYYPYYGDVARLDSNNDGVACESLPR